MSVNRETYDVWIWKDTKQLEIQLEYPDDTWASCNISGEPGERIEAMSHPPTRRERFARAQELQAFGFHL